MSSPNDSSLPTPKIIFASESMCSLINSAASFASIKPTSAAVTFNNTALAPSIDVSSNGEFTAAFAASTALFSPLALPIPMWAIPWSDIIDLTSAKSRLITFGTAISSEIPLTASISTWSAILNASTIDVLFSTICKSLSFGIVINVSTHSFKASIPPSADVCLFLPSNVKGRVTTPTVSIPCSFAFLATTGAAPVPVPPPIPAVINTMSAPFSASSISDSLSSAAFSPISGLAPAPSPLVSFAPICNLMSAFASFKVWRSVFNAINSTPERPPSLILLIALFPPPPTPITLILAKALFSTSMLIFAIFIPRFIKINIFNYFHLFRQDFFLQLQLLDSYPYLG